MPRIQKRSGFTLIELLVVISIIAILVAAGTVSWTNAQVKGRDTKRKADIRTIQNALELYFQTNGRYPPYNDPPGSGDYLCWTTFINSNTYPQVRNALVPVYLPKMPDDPRWPGEQFYNYLYVKVAPGKYELYAALENPKDSEKGGPYTSGCGSTFYSQYNYKAQNQ